MRQRFMAESRFMEEWKLLTHQRYFISVRLRVIASQ